ncbi:MAG: T9SS type A sorting domain-containing protein, partial [Bacteroidia bacterium]|nr:T9SS type A sorting domain-containing protein [Bacteroidia bacterium]
DTAEAIAYRNLFAYLTVNSNYLDARQGALESAADIYGSCSFEVQQTNNAWYAVGVGPDTLTNDIQILSAQYPEVSCDLSANETLSLVFRFNESGCNTTIPAGDTIALSYTLNSGTPVSENLILAASLIAGDTINYMFNTGADLSVEMEHTIDFSIDYANDSIKENDDILNIKITNPLTLTNTDFLSFEKRIQVVDSFYVISGGKGEVLVQHRAAEPSSNWGLQLGARDFVDSLVTFPTNEPDNFNLNPEYGCSACFCVDASTWTNARMVFDLKQTYSLYYDSIMGLGNIPEFVSSARIMVNGTQVGDQFHPTANDTDQFVHYVINLDAYAGTSFEACFEGKHFLRWQEETIGGSTGDHTFIDNLFFTDSMLVGINDVESNTFSLFPNPSSGLFQIYFNSELNSDVIIEVFDITGRVLKNKRLDRVGEFVELDLSEYASGIYFVSVITNESRSSQKLILE